MALLVGAFALSACGGGGTTTPAPSTAAVTTPAPTTAATTPPASTAPTAATTAPGASVDPAVDPADDLEIGAPYAFEPLDDQVAAIFVAAMEDSLGEMADVLQVGVRQVLEGTHGTPAGLVIVMRFPGLPIAGEALLDGAAQGAAQGGEVESRNIGGQDVRIVESQGQAAVITLVDDDLVMIIGSSGPVGIDITTAIIESN